MEWSESSIQRLVIMETSEDADREYLERELSLLVEMTMKMEKELEVVIQD